MLLFLPLERRAEHCFRGTPGQYWLDFLAFLAICFSLVGLNMTSDEIKNGASSFRKPQCPVAVDLPRLYAEQDLRGIEIASEHIKTCEHCQREIRHLNEVERQKPSLAKELLKDLLVGTIAIAIGKSIIRSIKNT